MTLLGRNSPVPEHYAPEILYPIPRREAREALGLPAELPFHGEDVWHAWELSWLAPWEGPAGSPTAAGQPRSAVGRFAVAANSENLVESKSLKLYLNSLNQSVFESEQALVGTLQRDLSKVAAGRVLVEVLPVDSALLAPMPVPGTCVDAEVITQLAPAPDANLLSVRKEPGESQILHSHGLRSLCPVTAQPDWATVVLYCRDALVDAASLLSYIASFRQHQEYHEQCVERMYRDLRAAGLESFSVQALYTRRGGLDISPWRSSAPGPAPRLRSMRQ